MRTVLTACLLVLMLTLGAAAQDVNPYNVGPNGATPVFAVVNLTPTTSSAAIVASQGATVRTYITSLQCINQGSVDVLVNVYNGGVVSGGGGTLKTYIPCDANLGGSNAAINFIPALKMNAATAVNVGIGTSSATVGLQGVYVILNGFAQR